MSTAHGKEPARRVRAALICCGLVAIPACALDFDRFSFGPEDGDAAAPTHDGAVGVQVDGSEPESLLDSAVDSGRTPGNGGRDSGADASDVTPICLAGQRLSDAGTCVAADPCDDGGGCEHDCHVEGATARCSCRAGYRLALDQAHCTLAAWSDSPIELDRPAEDVDALSLSIAPVGHAMVLVRQSYTLRSRTYDPESGWSAGFSEVPGQGHLVPTTNLVMLDDRRAVLLWHGYGGGPTASFIYSSLWDGAAWTVAARRDVQNYDGAYGASLVWDGGDHLTAAWYTYDQLVRPHPWVERFHMQNGWLGANPVEPFDWMNSNSPTSTRVGVVGVQPGHSVVVINRGPSESTTLAYRQVEGAASLTPFPGNPHTGGWKLVGNRRGTAFLVSTEASCQAYRYTPAAGFAGDAVASATVTAPACPAIVDHSGDAWTYWVDTTGALRLARSRATSVDALRPSGAWDVSTIIAQPGSRGITSPVVAFGAASDDRVAIWHTTSNPTALMGSYWVEGDGWTVPRRLSRENGSPVTASRVDMDALGNAVVVFGQEHEGSRGLWAVHLR